MYFYTFSLMAKVIFFLFFRLQKFCILVIPISSSFRRRAKGGACQTCHKKMRRCSKYRDRKSICSKNLSC